jgi:hypothetical protein
MSGLRLGAGGLLGNSSWSLASLALLPPTPLASCARIESLLAEAPWWVSCAVCDVDSSTVHWLPELADVYGVETPLASLLLTDETGGTQRQAVSVCRPPLAAAEIAIVCPTYPGHTHYISRLVWSLL